ncbi:UNVERIFIED_CONTAM: hypothetical protein RMT77_003326 [Armadillidium vulgare]
MSSFVQRLRHAEEDELQYLISKAKDHLPDSITVYRFLAIGFQKKFIDKKQTKIYVPCDKTLPFFIIITGILIKNRNNMTAYWNPKEISIDKARNLLKSLPDWDWETPSIIIDTPVATLKEIDEIVLSEGGLSNNKLYSKSTEIVCYIYDEGADSNKVSKINYPLASLNEKYADIVYKNWGYHHCEDIEGVKRCLEIMPSMAAYERESPELKNTNYLSNIDNNDEDNKLSGYSPIAWVLTRPQGEMGFAFTVPEHRNKGLFTAVMKELIKKLLDIGITPLVNIDGWNLISARAHEKLGFKRYCQLEFHAYLLQGMDMNEL